ncbi:MAG TPA: EamA family transporter [Anaerolineales bacterium]|jgi:drug/metabolite transporter (DMT)-like permease|nr:EamA family transporter [Anaerolineales bacterium]
MMRWLPYALLCSIFLASADFFVKLASNKIASSMGMLVYGATTFTVGLTWVGYLKLTQQPLLITQQGFLYALAVGMAFSAVTVLLYVTFARVSVSLGSPAIRVMGILIASLLGILLLHEPFTWRYLLGLILTVAGVVLIVFR